MGQFRTLICSILSAGRQPRELVVLVVSVPLCLASGTHTALANGSGPGDRVSGTWLPHCQFLQIPHFAAFSFLPVVSMIAFLSLINFSLLGHDLLCRPALPTFSPTAFRSAGLRSSCTFSGFGFILRHCLPCVLLLSAEREGE